MNAWLSRVCRRRPTSTPLTASSSASSCTPPLLGLGRPSSSRRPTSAASCYHMHRPGNKAGGRITAESNARPGAAVARDAPPPRACPCRSLPAGQATNALRNSILPKQQLGGETERSVGGKTKKWERRLLLFSWGC
ncbi:hypothetical protein D1007_49904 [Hordeum vulgare]|nr:hypothetical protein D1007_49904 [Hordeum vulgare]